MAEHFDPQRVFDDGGQLASKVCPECEERKNADQFWRNPAYADGGRRCASPAQRRGG